MTGTVDKKQASKLSRKELSNTIDELLNKISDCTRSEDEIAEYKMTAAFLARIWVRRYGS